MLLFLNHVTETDQYVIYYIRKHLQIKGSIYPTFHRIVKNTMSLYMTNSPKLEHIIDGYVNSVNCVCLSNFSLSTCKDVVKYIIKDLHISPECSIIKAVIHYHTFEKRFPTKEEINEMMTNLIEITVEPAQYCENKRLLVPTPHISKLKPIKNEFKNISCSICQEEIKQKTEIYKLPCGDKFHAPQCPGTENGILTWLKKSRKCPNCNLEVDLNKVC